MAARRLGSAFVSAPAGNPLGRASEQAQSSATEIIIGKAGWVERETDHPSPTRAPRRWDRRPIFATTPSCDQAEHRADRGRSPSRVTCDVHPAGRGQLYRHAGVEAAVSCGGLPRRLCRAGSIPRIKRVSFRGGPRWRCTTRKKDERRTAPQNRQTSAVGSLRASIADVSHFDGATTGRRSILWDDRPRRLGQVRITLDGRIPGTAKLIPD